MKKLFFLTLAFSQPFLQASEQRSSVRTGGGSRGGARPVAPTQNLFENLFIYQGIVYTKIGTMLQPTVPSFAPVRIFPGIELINYKEAMNAGYYPRWEWLHREGWREYAPQESAAIEKAHQAKKASVLLKAAGKEGNPYTIHFNRNEVRGDIPHGEQVRPGSVKRYAVRRVLLRPDRVNLNNLDGWLVHYNTLPRATVQSYFDGVEAQMRWTQQRTGVRPSRQEEINASRLAFQQLAEEAKQKLIESKEGIAREVEIAKFDTSIFDKMLLFTEVRGDKRPVQTVQWWHSSGPRAYSGAESKLIRDQLAAHEEVCFLNGGRPHGDMPSRPYKIVFKKHWRCHGGQAEHYQLDLATGNRRGIYFSEVHYGDKDYIYYCWLDQFKKVPGMKAHEIYERFLQKVVLGGRTVENIIQAEAEAQAELHELNEQSRWCPPAQADAPPEFFCPITCCLIVDPVVDANNPKAGTFEREALTLWVGRNRSNPTTRTGMTVEDIAPDETMRQRLLGWCSGFVEAEAQGHGDAGIAPIAEEIPEGIERIAPVSAAGAAAAFLAEREAQAPFEGYPRAVETIEQVGGGSKEPAGELLTQEALQAALKEALNAGNTAEIDRLMALCEF